MRDIQLIELHRSGVGMNYGCLTLLNVLILVANRDYTYWAGDWHATSIAIAFPVVIMAPVAAALAAYQGLRRQRFGVRQLEETMPLPPWRPMLLQWAILTTAALAAYLTGALVAAGITLSNAPQGPVWVSFPLLGAAALAVAVAVGLWTGRMLATRWSPALAGVVVLAWFLTLSRAPEHLQRLALLQVDVFSPPDKRLSTPILILSLVFAVLLDAALILLQGRAQRLTTQVTAGILAVAAAVALVGFPGSTLVARAPRSPVCAGAQPRVCLWPEHAKWVPLAGEVAGRLSAALPSAFPAGTTYAEAGLSEAAGSEFTLKRGPVSRISMADSLATTILPRVPPECVRDDRASFRNYVLLHAWLQQKGAGAVDSNLGVTPDQMAELEALPLWEQRSWVDQAVTAVHACTPLPAPPSSP